MDSVRGMIHLDFAPMTCENMHLLMVKRLLGKSHGLETLTQACTPGQCIELRSESGCGRIESELRNVCIYT